MQHLWICPCEKSRFRGIVKSISSPGEVFRLPSNWTTCSTACASPRLFLWVLILRSYFPGGQLNALALPLEGSILPMASCHRLGRGLQGYLHFVTSLGNRVTKCSRFYLIGANFWSLPRSFCGVKLVLDNNLDICYTRSRKREVKYEYKSSKICVHAGSLSCLVLFFFAFGCSRY